MKFYYQKCIMKLWPVMYAVKRYNLKYIITDDMILSKLRRFSNSVKQHNFTFCLHWRQTLSVSTWRSVLLGLDYFLLVVLFVHLLGISLIFILCGFNWTAFCPRSPPSEKSLFFPKKTTVLDNNYTHKQHKRKHIIPTRRNTSIFSVDMYI